MNLEANIFVLYEKPCSAINDIVDYDNYVEVTRGTDKAVLEREAERLDKLHPSKYHFVGMPKENVKTDKEPEFTPGPWKCVPTSNHAHDYRLTLPDGRPLPYCVKYNDHSEARANAVLIASAPDLLEAIEGLLDAYGQSDGKPACECIDNEMPGHCPWCQVRTAIAKAKGLL